MKQILHRAAILLALCSMAVAQEHTQPAATQITRQQLTLQGSGIFTRKVTDSGLTYRPTSTAGILAGYRFNINRWLGVEGDFDGFQNSQKFLTSADTARLKTNVYAATGLAVIGVPNPLTKKFQSFMSIGGGALVFHPRDTSLVSRQTRSVIAFGGGIDVPLSRRIAVRAQANTFLYKAPDFESNSLHTDKYVQTVIPSIGVVYKF